MRCEIHIQIHHRSLEKHNYLCIPIQHSLFAILSCHFYSFLLLNLLSIWIVFVKSWHQSLLILTFEIRTGIISCCSLRAVFTDRVEITELWKIWELSKNEKYRFKRFRDWLLTSSVNTIQKQKKLNSYFIEWDMSWI